MFLFWRNGFHFPPQNLVYLFSPSLAHSSGLQCREADPEQRHSTPHPPTGHGKLLPFSTGATHRSDFRKTAENHCTRPHKQNHFLSSVSKSKRRVPPNPGNILQREYRNQRVRYEQRSLMSTVLLETPYSFLCSATFSRAIYYTAHHLDGIGLPGLEFYCTRRGQPAFPLPGVACCSVNARKC